MENQATHLRRAVEHRKDYLKAELVKYGYRPDRGEQLDKATLTDLEALHIKVKSEFGKELSQDE
jgi:hypothetical protein